MEPKSDFFIPSNDWCDYALLDSGEGMKLERFGTRILARPEQSAIWRRALSKEQWDAANGIFRGGGEEDEPAFARPGGLRHAVAELQRGEGGGKGWQFKKDLSRWQMQWGPVKFFVEPTPFRHVGVFPEQASQWEWIDQALRQAQGKRPLKILNLFGYTGIASLVAAASGAEVTHVDASKKMISWARENQKLSGLPENPFDSAPLQEGRGSREQGKPIRWIVDDALKFVKREVRRGATYDGFIIDPPKFGRGPKGEIWHIYDHLPVLLDECQKLFSNNLLFINLTCYAIRVTPLSLRYALEERLTGRSGIIEQGELALKEQSAGRLLPQAVCARWSNL